MSSFACEVVRVKIIPHPNADAIEIAQVGDYQSIVRKGQLRDGNLAVYIPEQALVPEWLLREMGLWDDVKGKGRLHGSGGNRVKAIKLRGVLSQGLILPCVEPEDCETPGVENGESGNAMSVGEGDDVAEFLGIVKYEPAIPSHMRAKIIGVDHANTHKYDFDSIKKAPSMFKDGESVVITEKIHGTNIQIGVVPTSAANERYYKGRVFVTSKGMGGNGFVLDHNDPTNLYAQAAIKHGLFDSMLNVFGDEANVHNKPILAFGEVYGLTNTGKGVQDLTYDGEVLGLRLFDICIGNRDKESYLPHHDFVSACEEMGVRYAPVLYIGPYSKDALLRHTDGPTTLAPQAGKPHIREGVVIKSLSEDKDSMGRRKIAKSISEAYLLRKGDVTEFN